ncbi:MAG: flagellar basal body P-ring formation protein FlgA [Bryobacterales bacterium]|nr:flagellar basal body P-ring formation protein FlgA [Bryobacterales bacterium]
MSHGRAKTLLFARVFLALLPALLPDSAASAACLPVSGLRIAARDLAPLIPAFADAEVAEDLGPSPAPGYRRNITAAGIAAWAARNGVVATGGAGACFEWQLEPIGREQIAAALSSALPSGAVVEIVDHSRFSAPSGVIKFPRSGLSLPTGISSVRPVIWRGLLSYAPGRSVPVWARVRASISVSRAVAAEVLPALKTIASSQIRFETADVFPFPEATLLEPVDIIGKTPRRSLRAGQTLTKDLLTDAPEVERGAHIAVQAQSGGALLRFSAIALTGGRKGETILLRNPSNGRNFKAEITSKGQAAAIEPVPDGKNR